jgi:hypothetical protein
MECPDCGVENPPEAEACDCGYDVKTDRCGAAVHRVIGKV